ncbi:MAG: NDP-sugar synthase [Syntrophomonadaceae bacterium]|jgi:mannose-1-phosphate guanylyltransferase|nr:NDP-sugar synthase [Syntrophomonadaceae bacterium]
MKAMIMAAGVGSRLMPLTAAVPKPMVPMANRPLMENIVEVLGKHGFTGIIANLHHQGPLLKGYFGGGEGFGVSLQYSEEAELMGTAGGVKRCEWFLGGDTFVVMSGDALTDVDLSELVAVHKQKGALATIALKEVEDVENYGVVITDEEGRIKSFQEKPPREQALSRVVNSGIYVFESEVFRYIPEGQFYDFGRQVFPDLVQMGAPFYGHVIDGYWCDVGNFETYRRSHADILAGQVKYQVRGQVLEGTLGGRVLLGEGVKLGKGVTFKGCVVIGSGCHIGNGAVIEDSIIWEDTMLEARSVIREAVIGAGCTVGAGAVVNPGAVVASGCTVPADGEVPAGSRVFATEPLNE